MNNNFKKIIMVLVAIVIVIGAAQYLGFINTNQDGSMAQSASETLNNAAKTASTNLDNAAQDANAAITAAAKSATAAVQSKQTIVATASSTPSLKTFTSLVQAAGLTDTLNASGPFTVFAPTDSAFAKLPAATLANLQKPENKAELQRVLSYHVLKGKYSSQDLAAQSSSQSTVAGLPVTISTASGLKVNNATVASANIAASNGIIHAIDAVLIPSPASVPTN